MDSRSSLQPAAQNTQSETSDLGRNLAIQQASWNCNAMIVGNWGISSGLYSWAKWSKPWTWKSSCTKKTARDWEGPGETPQKHEHPSVIAVMFWSQDNLRLNPTSFCNQIVTFWFQNRMGQTLIWAPVWTKMCCGLCEADRSSFTWLIHFPVVASIVWQKNSLYWLYAQDQREIQKWGRTIFDWNGKDQPSISVCGFGIFPASRCFLSQNAVALWGTANRPQSCNICFVLLWYVCANCTANWSHSSMILERTHQESTCGQHQIQI